MKSDVLIIGGGASGLVCAIATKLQKPNYKITVLEKNDRVGKKLLATGNGRCNLGNIYASPKNYHSVSGNAEDFVKTALEEFNPQNNADFFHNLGLLIKTDEAGRQYPYTNQAGSVLDILRLQLEALGVTIITDAPATKITKTDSFTVKTPQGDFKAEKLVLATGGIASPQISNSEGMDKVLQAFGHKTTEKFSALTQIKTAGNLPKAMKGIRIPCEISLKNSEQIVKSESGEILFADYGVSGIPAFQLSRKVSENFAKNNPEKQTLVIDTLPQLSMAEIEALLKNRRDNFSTTLENYLTGIINKKLGQQILKICGLSPLSRDSKTLLDGEIQTIAYLLKHLELNVTGTTGWKNAQVTAGGLYLSDFNNQTMESKIVAGFYAIGEALDIDGDCGGYNLTWAWSSARLTAQNL